MKYVVVILLLVFIFIMMPGCESTKPDEQTQSEAKSDTAAVSIAKQDTNTNKAISEEPLLLEDEPLLLDVPLLLEDKFEDESADSGADNSRCHVCHINYASEEIAVTHAKVGKSCSSCHGESDEHIADESWASGGNGTAPDKMYPAETINPFCMTCHTKEKIDEPQHAPVFADGDKQKVCTDCHGEHRLPNRKCKWK